MNQFRDYAGEDDGCFGGSLAVSGPSGFVTLVLVAPAVGASVSSAANVLLIVSALCAQPILVVPTARQYVRFRRTKVVP